MKVNGYEIKPGANLQDANLYGANLQGANVTGTILEKKEDDKDLKIQLLETEGLMPELSPETQKIVNAAVDVTGYGKETPLLKRRIAAALRAAADQVMPGRPHPHRTQLLTIAAELEQ